MLDVVFLLTRARSSEGLAYNQWMPLAGVHGVRTPRQTNNNHFAGETEQQEQGADGPLGGPSQAPSPASRAHNVCPGGVGDGEGPIYLRLSFGLCDSGVEESNTVSS